MLKIILYIFLQIPLQVACSLLVASLFFPLPAFSASQAEQEPLIDEIVISVTNGHLLLFATVRHCFTDEMLEGVRNGIPLTFRFDIRLKKIRNNWFDSELIEHKINHTLSYDTLKEEYQVAFAEKDRPEVTRSLEEAKQMMADLNGLQLYPLNELQVGSPYSLKIKATLVENTFPLGIHSIIPFTSLWNFETDWRIVEFNY
ncbi:hypothetical protein H206_01866 [Candidatus Electrothrix aarhusensis]|jgi:hypothetical protein|uniref:DUF4390 domain-containing protein n=1 Tax=Candidatus Electrothrix aarhusensis TaxID=1859131 RepID=A0A444IUS6_9BACT|nr:hypothetical protein H206_01866 [Candidatus Electrothrix aarhusensis]